MQSAALQKAYKFHPVTYRLRHIEAHQRIVKIGRTVNPDMVIGPVDFCHDVVAFPFSIQKPRCIHDFAEPENQLCALSFKICQCFFNFATQADVDAAKAKPLKLADTAYYQAQPRSSAAPADAGPAAAQVYRPPL